MKAYLQFVEVEKRYGEITALERVSLEVEQGSVLALLGPNGAGKSTLFGCLLGLIQPGSGRVLYQGNPAGAELRRRTGYMPERITLYPQNSVLENGTFFARLKGHLVSEFERQLKRVGLYDVQDRPAGSLSKGMLQRLGLAIALCGAPELLVLDEPFNGLDPALLDALQQILKEERARGATLIVSTHTISAVEPMTSHVAVLLEGRLAANGALVELREKLREPSLEAIYYSIARKRAGQEVLA